MSILCSLCLWGRITVIHRSAAIIATVILTWKIITKNDGGENLKWTQKWEKSTKKKFDGKATPTTNNQQMIKYISILWMCVCVCLFHIVYGILFILFFFDIRICLHIIRWAHLWLIIIIVIAPRNRKVNYDKLLS